MLRKIENEKRALAALCECIFHCYKKLMSASAFPLLNNYFSNSFSVRNLIISFTVDSYVVSSLRLGR